MFIRCHRCEQMGPNSMDEGKQRAVPGHITQSMNVRREIGMQRIMAVWTKLDPRWETSKSNCMYGRSEHTHRMCFKL